jgi:hypothetical protein
MTRCWQFLTAWREVDQGLAGDKGDAYYRRLALAAVMAGVPVVAASIRLSLDLFNLKYDLKGDVFRVLASYSDADIHATARIAEYPDCGVPRCDRGCKDCSPVNLAVSCESYIAKTATSEADIRDLLDILLAARRLRPQQAQLPLLPPSIDPECMYWLLCNDSFIQSDQQSFTWAFEVIADEILQHDPGQDENALFELFATKYLPTVVDTRKQNGSSNQHWSIKVRTVTACLDSLLEKWGNLTMLNLSGDGDKESILFRIIHTTRLSCTAGEPSKLDFGWYEDLVLVRVILYLSAQGIDNSVPLFCHSETLLHCLVTRKHLSQSNLTYDTVEALLLICVAAGLDPGEVDEHGLTPLAKFVQVMKLAQPWLGGVPLSIRQILTCSPVCCAKTANELDAQKRLFARQWRLCTIPSARRTAHDQFKARLRECFALQTF